MYNFDGIYQEGVCKFMMTWNEGFIIKSLYIYIDN